jgi:hypothetical protein
VLAYFPATAGSGGWRSKTLLSFCRVFETYGLVAQWIRHRPTEPEIAGSSPAGVIASIICCGCVGSKDASRHGAIASLPAPAWCHDHTFCGPPSKWPSEGIARQVPRRAEARIKIARLDGRVKFALWDLRCSNLQVGRKGQYYLWHLCCNNLYIGRKGKI